MPSKALNVITSTRCHCSLCSNGVMWAKHGAPITVALLPHSGLVVFCGWSSVVVSCRVQYNNPTRNWSSTNDYESGLLDTIVIQNWSVQYSLAPAMAAPSLQAGTVSPGRPQNCVPSLSRLLQPWQESKTVYLNQEDGKPRVTPSCMG